MGHLVDTNGPFTECSYRDLPDAALTFNNDKRLIAKEQHKSSKTPQSCRARPYHASPRGVGRASLLLLFEKRNKNW
jgi:hypothetical protein